MSSADVALGDVVECRHHLVTDLVATEPQVVVRLVLHRSESELAAQRTRLGAAQRQQRAVVPAHAGEAIEAGAAQQVEQHGLGLVVDRVPREHIGRERRVAGRARPCFEVGTRSDLSALRTKRGTAGARDLGDDLGVAFGPGPETVVDIHRRDITARFPREDQQGQ